MILHDPPTRPQKEISGIGLTDPPDTVMVKPSTSSKPAMSLAPPSGLAARIKVKVLEEFPSGYSRFSLYGEMDALRAVWVGYKLK
jgi:hypothetical protein